jgi:hypothetical protein
MEMYGNGVMIGTAIIQKGPWQTLMVLIRGSERYVGAGAGSGTVIHADPPIETMAIPPAGIEQPALDLSGAKQAIRLAKNRKKTGFLAKKNVRMVPNFSFICSPQRR